MVGEIGGAEEEGGRVHQRADADAGRRLHRRLPGAPGKQMGHAGAIITGSSGTAQAKKDALEARGVRVNTNPTEVAEIARDVLGPG